MGALFLWFGLDALRTGLAWGTHGTYQKDEHPSMYNFIVAMQLVVGVGSILMGIFGLPPGAKP